MQRYAWMNAMNALGAKAATIAFQRLQPLLNTAWGSAC
jgi:hypothetical protein